MSLHGARLQAGTFDTGASSMVPPAPADGAMISWRRGHRLYTCKGYIDKAHTNMLLQTRESNTAASTNMSSARYLYVYVPLRSWLREHCRLVQDTLARGVDMASKLADRQGRTLLVEECGSLAVGYSSLALSTT
jgi:hypothetical protein